MPRATRYPREALSITNFVVDKREKGRPCGGCRILLSPKNAAKLRQSASYPFRTLATLPVVGTNR